jgi:flagellar L-ring protein precursor FlgH
MKPKSFLVLLGVLWTLLLSGCATPPKPGDPAYAPTRPAEPPPPTPVYTGSLYREGYDVRLFEDVVARRVGDILTIRLEEKTDAQKQADTDVSKDSTYDGSTELSGSGLSVKPFSANFNLGANREFEGGAESKQSNRLKGSISVVVSEVLPNGNLVVRGEKWMTLNQGDEFIRITGIVRPQDIEPDNTVPSYLVADARIGYGGTGPLADANTLGWITRFFISAIFPF